MPVCPVCVAGSQPLPVPSTGIWQCLHCGFRNRPTNLGSNGRSVAQCGGMYTRSFLTELSLAHKSCGKELGSCSDLCGGVHQRAIHCTGYMLRYVLQCLLSCSIFVKLCNDNYVMLSIFWAVLSSQVGDLPGAAFVF